MTPEDLVEIELIKQLKARYYMLMDQKRWDEWANVFCEDCTIDSTQDGAPLIHGRQAFVDFLSPMLQEVKTCHHGHMPIIDLTSPTTAVGTWSMEDMLWFPEGSERRFLWGVGWYFEKYRKDDDGQWRILELTLRRTRVEVDGKEVFAPDTPPRGHH